MSGIEVKVNGRQFKIAIDKGTDHLTEEEMRGVVSKGVNAIRDQARQNAIGVGLSRSGPTTYRDGSRHTRRGKIPSAIYSWVMTNEGDSIPGRVSIDTRARRGPNQTFHWVWVEFGTRFRAPRPFFFRALNEAKGRALTEMQKRFDEGVQRSFK